MTLEEARTLLRSRQDFEESNLVGFASSNLLRTFNVVVSSTWAGEGVLRPDLNIPRPEILSFDGCQSVRIENFFSEGHLGPEANWGLSEFSLIKVAQGREDLLLFSFLWEGERIIQIECASLSINGDLEAVEGFARKWLDASLAPLLKEC